LTRDGWQKYGSGRKKLEGTGRRGKTREEEGKRNYSASSWLVVGGGNGDTEEEEKEEILRNKAEGTGPVTRREGGRKR